MIAPILEQLAESINYGDLPETWQVQDIDRFSVSKSLYDYQADAMRLAARALFMYYDARMDTIIERKQRLLDAYHTNELKPLQKYESPNARKNDKQNPIFNIFAEYFTAQGDTIPYVNLINRMCFWMATGSGKTLVMVKLIEYLHTLIQHQHIPAHNILILAPSEHLLRQIRVTVDDFNRAGSTSTIYIELLPLREIHKSRQSQLGNTVTIYYHRSDNISDVQKDMLSDYRRYENDGKWYIFLDEAHKGGKENSKRQAYYAVMARAGFMFNFSATFTDREDIITTVKKYNLKDFISNGHGKNIYLNEEEYTAFRNRQEDISSDEQRKIVLKSLVTLAYISLRANALKQETGLDNIYHKPLMLTLVNSVNTESKSNDLWAFFEVLRDIANSQVNANLLKQIKLDLIKEWTDAQMVFGGDGGGIIGIDNGNELKKMSLADVREAVFLSRRKGALQVIIGDSNKELAFQLKSANSPFALIRIGDTHKWRAKLLNGYEETKKVQSRAFFDELENSPITILMGSRAFFESWDSNRPNIINFINIGGHDAKKFVVQSVGRGVRIETLPEQRRRLAKLPPNASTNKLMEYHDLVQPIETLFLFATNKNAIRAILDGMGTEREGDSTQLSLLGKNRIDTNSRQQLDNMDMPLLVPKYHPTDQQKDKPNFVMSKDSLLRFHTWLDCTSDTVLLARDGLAPNTINLLRKSMQNGSIITSNANDYVSMPFAQKSFVAHLKQKIEIADDVRDLNDKDIVHFKEIRINPVHLRALDEKINKVKKGEVSDEKLDELYSEWKKGNITRNQYNDLSTGTSEETYHDLRIKNLTNHYYVPLIISDNEKIDYIRHVIKISSEVKFVNDLEAYLTDHNPKWEAWMFSKLDESLDNVYIPYYDKTRNSYRQFNPDFIFWLANKDDYRIVFVDPKGTEHTASQHKIDGYEKLFIERENQSPRIFNKDTRRVSVHLLMYHPEKTPSGKYAPYWITGIEKIFSNSISTG